MSGANSQKVRRNAASPSTRQGPLRATQQFALVGGSPSRKNVQVVRQAHTSSPTSKSQPIRTAKARSHSETGFVSERRSPTPGAGSQNYKVERPKALRAAGSLDNISLYLSGQWPKDSCVRQKSPHEVSPGLCSGTHMPTGSNLSHQNLHSNPQSVTTLNDATDVCIKDEHTQTPDEWEDLDTKKAISAHRGFVPYKRSKSVGSTENWLKSKDIKARLQRKDNSGRTGQSSQRYSPVPVLTNSLSPRASASQPIKIPVPIHENGVLRGTPGKARASVEGLNPEIEKLIISATSTLTTEDEQRSGVLPMHLFEHPDGHRAPIPESLNNLRDVDTQTPNQSELFMGGDSMLEPSLSDYYGGLRSVSRASSDTESASSRPQSISPSPFLLGPLDIEDLSSECLGDTLHRPGTSTSTSTSPRPNSAKFVRLPPDGAEKLKIVNEIATVPHMKTLLTPALMSTIKLQPSEGSAFSSLAGKRGPAVSGFSSLSATSAVPTGPSRSPVRLVEESH